jgi:aryl-alcohol dehydrogenase-like predicted oxidoreductase
MKQVLPWCQEHGIGFLPFAPLGRGFLTGTVTQASFGPHDFRARNPRFTPEAMAANQRIVDVVKAVADGYGVTPAQVALAWLLTLGPYVVPIPGTKKVRYLEQNAAADELRLTEHDLGELASLPAPVGARY